MVRKSRRSNSSTTGKENVQKPEMVDVCKQQYGTSK